MRDICGNCHCRNINYVMQWPFQDSPTLRKCSCSFCSKHGAIYTAHPLASIRISITHSDDIIAYQFAMKSSTFVICKTCGVMTFVATAIDGHNYAVVNANTFNEALSSPKIVAHNFDSETIEDRLRRRQANWIRNVSIIGCVSEAIFPQNWLIS